MWRIGSVLVVLLAMLAITATAAALNFKVIGSDGNAAANADYRIYYTNGSLASSGRLDSNGTANITLAEGTYVAIVVGGESIIDDFNVDAATTEVTIDAATLKALNVSASAESAITTPSVKVKFVPDAYSNLTYEFNTNWTIYTDLANKLTFPNETKALFMTFALKSITVNGNVFENVTTVAIPMTENTNVVAYYESTIPVLEPVYLIIIVALIGLALVAVIITSGKKAKSIARERIEDSFRFYRRIK